MLSRPAPQTLLHLLERQSTADLSYPEGGASRGHEVLAGYRHDRYRAVLGSGDDVFSVAAQGLRTWRAHTDAGVQIIPPDAPVAAGQNVVLVVQVGPAWAIAPCRIVYVIDEDDCFGFAYGTLPGHPEQGEESFIVERDQSGLATFHVAAFSRPADLLARVGAPVARVVQRRVTKRYLRALAEFVTPSPSR